MIFSKFLINDANKLYETLNTYTSTVIYITLTFCILSE